MIIPPQPLRIARPARKHKLSAGRIRSAVAGATLVDVDGDAWIYRGTTADGFEIEMVIVPDNKREDSWTVIHAMPTKWEE